ncbi:PH domain-containing protein [Paenisporosarcina sp. FSL H8-0542]|uniref:PH domain-containing protein n=1 Tax=Paenisporosarcina sp. FSL H8-0542 TaxID=2921401 RepID=UPI00315B23E2
MAIRKLNQQYLLLEYPVTLEDMERILPELPKTERTYFEYAFKALNKIMKKDEKIYNFNIADPKLTKTGYIVVAEKNLIMLSLKGGLFGGMDSEVLKYEDIKDVDFDVTPNPFGLAQMNLGVVYLGMKGMFGGKKRTIRNIPEENLDNVVSAIRDKVNK